jgi:hypothetical protein
MFTARTCEPADGRCRCSRTIAGCRVSCVLAHSHPHALTPSWRAACAWPTELPRQPWVTQAPPHMPADLKPTTLPPCSWRSAERLGGGCQVAASAQSPGCPEPPVVSPPGCGLVQQRTTMGSIVMPCCWRRDEALACRLPCMSTRNHVFRMQTCIHAHPFMPHVSACSGHRPGHGGVQLRAVQHAPAIRLRQAATLHACCLPPAPALPGCSTPTLPPQAPLPLLRPPPPSCHL